MPVVVAVVGDSDSGTTRVASSLVETLAGQGFSVAAVKHRPDEHRVSRPDSDSDRLLRAGAAAVVASSPGKSTKLTRVESDPSLESIVKYVGATVDIVVAEGFKTSGVPKVLVVDGKRPSPAVGEVIATVGADQPVGESPNYRFEDLGMLAAQLRGELIEIDDPTPMVSLTLDGSATPLSRFATSALDGIIRGYVACLKGVPVDPEEIHITVLRRPASGRGNKSES